jgi:hypothetical protein
MSEYQYYAFQAVDRPLGEAEMRALRALSSRARITPTSFVNEYDFGDFRGRPETLMEKYFDAHVYFANWGSQRLMLRLPRRLLDEKAARSYCAGRLAKVRTKGEFVILDFNADDESDAGEWEEGGGWLASLIPIRQDLLQGDLRALYLGWLLSAQGGDLDDEEIEPPVPPRLGQLSASLEGFADFLNIDPALIEVAAEGQEEGADDARAAMASWIDALPLAKKNDYLLRLVESDDPHLRAELLQSVQREHQTRAPDRHARARRSVGELLAAARVRAEENRRKEADREVRERALAEKKAARNQKKRFVALMKDLPAAWRKVDGLIATAEPAKYDDAVSLLVDLRDLAAREGNVDPFTAKLNGLRAQHKTKQALLRRINRAGLRPTRGG